MHTIHKFPIAITAHQQIATPGLHKLLHVSLDPKGQPCIWAEVMTNDYPTSRLNVWVFGTGSPIDLPYDAEYLGTFVDSSSTFVWHVYTS